MGGPHSQEGDSGSQGPLSRKSPERKRACVLASRPPCVLHPCELGGRDGSEIGASLTLPSCVTLDRSLDLSELCFLTCKMGIMKPISWTYVPLVARAGRREQGLTFPEHTWHQVLVTPLAAFPLPSREVGKLRLRVGRSRSCWCSHRAECRDWHSYEKLPELVFCLLVSGDGL